MPSPAAVADRVMILLAKIPQSVPGSMEKTSLTRMIRGKKKCEGTVGAYRAREYRG